jgi:hypothetical protein
VYIFGCLTFNFSELIKDYKKGQKQMGLLGTAEITGAERLQCLDYYEAEVRVTAFQTKEADLFNEALATYSDAITTDPAAAGEVRAAAQRLIQAANEIIRRRDEIQSIPEAAFSMHWTWHVTSVAYAAWAQATLSAMEALANGMTPYYSYLRHLTIEHETAWHKAQREEKKFLKLLRMPAREVDKVIDRSMETAENDDWQPVQPSVFDAEEVTSETTVHSCS